MRRRGSRLWFASTLVVVALLSTAVGAAAAGEEGAGRVSPVLGAEFRISGPGAVANDEPAAVAWNSADNEYLVVWSDERRSGVRGRDIYGRLVAPDGSALGGDFRISGRGAVADEDWPAVAWNAAESEYLVVWQDYRNYDERGIDVYGRRVAAAGVPVGGDFRISGTLAQNEMDPAVAWNAADNEYLVAWTDTRNWMVRDFDVYGMRLGPEGSRLGAAFRISGPGALGADGGAAVAWNGTDYLVVWSDNRRAAMDQCDIYGRRVAADGSRPGPDFRISALPTFGGKWWPAVAWNAGAGEYLVVWSDERNYGERGRDVYGRRVAAGGSRLGVDFRISGGLGAGNEEWPAVAWNEDDAYLVAWSDERNGLEGRGVDMYGRFVAADGSRPAADFRISGALATGNEYPSAVVWNAEAGEFLATWLDTRNDAAFQIYGRRVAG